MSLKDTDVRTPGDAAIAKKFKLSLAKVRNLVSQGAKHEKEHNTDLAKAKEVARDHIGERPDYYKMLKKAEKTPVSMKEENATGAVRGLGFVTGDPGVSYVDQYINTNAMAYYDENGNKLEYLKKLHTNLHNSKLGYDAFDPTRIGANKNFIKEAKLNELGEYDNKGGTPGYEETSGPIRAIRKRDVKEQSPANVSYKERPMYEKSTGNSPMPAGAERGIYEVSQNKVSSYVTKAATQLATGELASSRRKEQNRITGIKTGVRKLHPDMYQGGAKVPVNEDDAETIKDLNNKFFNKEPSLDDIRKRREAADSGAYKDVADRMRKGIPKGLTDLSNNSMYEQTPSHLHLNKPDTKYAPGAAGTTHTIHEETKMDKEYINEALDCILEDNLPEMKDNLMKALQEKAIEKLEERKKEIAANYFAE